MPGWMQARQNCWTRSEVISSAQIPMTWEHSGGTCLHFLCWKLETWLRGAIWHLSAVQPGDSCQKDAMQWPRSHTRGPVPWLCLSALRWQRGRGEGVGSSSSWRVVRAAPGERALAPPERSLCWCSWQSGCFSARDEVKSRTFVTHSLYEQEELGEKGLTWEKQWLDFWT